MLAMENSLLGRLPIELRLDIYERVLHSEEGVNVTLKSSSGTENRPTESAHPLAIQAVCSDIYHETSGIVFAVNDVWRIKAPEADVRDWIKCLRRWLAQADPRHLRKARAVELDLGTWKTKRGGPSTCEDAATYSVATAGAVWDSLPVALKRPEIETTIKLRVDWTDGIRLSDGTVDKFAPYTIISRMWRAPKPAEILDDSAWDDKALGEYRDKAYESFRRYRTSWKDGRDDIPPFCCPPDYNEEGPRIYEEMKELERVAFDVEIQVVHFFHREMYETALSPRIDAPEGVQEEEEGHGQE